MSRLQAQYREKVIPELKTKLKRDNVHAIPRLVKIVVSMGVGKAREDRKHLDEAMEHLAQITGQRRKRPAPASRYRPFGCGKGWRSAAASRSAAA